MFSLKPPVFEWYRLAAEQGQAAYQFIIGNCYFYGMDVVQDYVEAVKWYRKAADQGNSNAQINLGNCYENGLGVLKDYIEAYAYFNLAAVIRDEASTGLARLEEKMSMEAQLKGQQRTKELQKKMGK